MHFWFGRFELNRSRIWLVLLLFMLFLKLQSVLLNRFYQVGHGNITDTFSSNDDTSKLADFHTHLVNIPELTLVSENNKKILPG